MKKHPILVGTLILSSASIISRIIGFFYRIYLSRAFGAEALGVLQMTAPITAMVTAVSCAGIQTALSKRISELKDSDRQGQSSYLLCSLFWSVGLSCILAALVWQFSSFLSNEYLQEPRTEALLKITALSFPLSAAHGCFSGYYFGRRKTRVPAISQLIEQLVRVGCVVALCSLAATQGWEAFLSFAVLGSAIGELAAVAVCLISIRAENIRTTPEAHTSPNRHRQPDVHAGFNDCRRPDSLINSSVYFNCKKHANVLSRTGELFSIAIPLSFNRLALNFLQSLEAVRIPLSLQLYGYSSAQALTVYGILTGIALPVLFFPGAFLGAFNHMLLPTVSQAQSQKNYGKIRTLTVNTSFTVVFGGLLCGLAFFMFSDFLGGTVFGEPLAGGYIRSLCLLCPLLYLNQVLSGILQGLGKALTIFFINAISVFIRLGFVFFCIPCIGIQGYFYGLLASQLVTVCLFLSQFIRISRNT
ncbi:MAG: oligosaccharide flippase family protein [Lachnospiraceae bacterium]|nr:oligosaccharide flippase family protein [Lachnospiraceae bacterium]